MEPQSELGISIDKKSDREISITLRMSSLAFENSEVPRLLSFGGRGKEAESRDYKGKGMGLAMVQNLVKLNYGVFNVQADETSRHVVDGIPYSTNAFTVVLLANQNRLIEKLKEGEQSNRHVPK